MKEKNKLNQHYSPIVFMNTPISDDVNDVIGISSAADSIKQAVVKHAKIIGVIADYGSGKSSLTETLAADKETFGSSIIVNMWDSLSPKNMKEDTPNAINSLTKSFLYQIASGISENTAKYFNRRLSKNYGIISFSLSSGKFWLWIVIALICYVLFAGLSAIPIEQVNEIIKAIAPSITEKALLLWTSAIKYGAHLFLVAGIAVAIIGLRKVNIAYSHWKNQSPHESEINDVFEAYTYIQSKLRNKNHHRLIIVEDLDRIENKDLVVGFLKEVYRFCNLTSKTSKKGPVFVVSVKPESHLKKSDLNDEKTQESVDNDLIYPKIFDYSVSLKPIHYEDYENIIMQIIGPAESTERKALQSILDEKDRIKGETLPETFSWIATGHNLTIRQLKERLNNAVGLLISLKNKRYAHNPAIDFASCSAVTYLEAQYPEQYSNLINQEKEFSKLVQGSYAIRNIQKDEEKAEKMKEAVDKFFEETKMYALQNKEIIDAMKSDIVKMLLNGNISDDFRMYFYSYPKNSYIKNSDEKDISNLLLLPGEFHEDEALGEKVERIIQQKKEMTILEILEKIRDDPQKKSYPAIIVNNAFLFEKAYSINPQKAISTIHSLTSWEKDKRKSSQDVLANLYSYTFASKDQFWSEYVAWLLSRMDEFDDESKVDIRKRVIEVFGDEIVIFRSLFFDEGSTTTAMPIITEEELNTISSVSIGIPLMNITQISNESIHYIASYINREKLMPEIYKHAHQIYEQAIKSIPAETIWQYLIYFLRVNMKNDDSFFQFSVLNANLDERDKAVVSEYVNALPIDRVSSEYCDIIDQAIVDVNISDELLSLLYKENKYVALLSCLAKKEKLAMIDFGTSEDAGKIMDACSTLLRYDVGLILAIRMEIIKQFKAKDALEDLPETFNDIYYGDYPIITSGEYYEIDSILVMLRLLNRKLIASENCLEIATYINDCASADKCMEIIKYLFSEEYDDNYENRYVARDLIDAIDFRKIGFCDLGNDNQEKALDYIAPYIDLDNPDAADTFMRKCHCLIPRLEQIIVNSGKIDIYIGIINEIDAPSEYTIKQLSEMKISQGLSPNLLKILLDKNELQKYLICKVLADSEFEFPFPKVPNDSVLANYMTSSPIWDTIKDNWELKNYIVSNKAYKEFNVEEFPDVLRPLYTAKQDAEFVCFVLEHVPNEGKIEFLQNMGVIVDASNSMEIARALQEEPYVSLFDNKELFYKVRERLWEEAPKAYKHVFTKKRNERFPNDKA